MTSEAFMRSDRETVGRHIALPLHMRTQTSEFILENAEQVSTGLDVFHRSLQTQGVNHFIRLATSAEYLSDDYIEGHYMTHTLCNAIPVVPAYPCRAILRRDGELWQFTQIDTSLQNKHWPISMPRVTPGTRPFWAEIDNSEDARRSAQSALSLYQDFLDTISRSNMENDFATWVAHCTFPHYAHMDQIDSEIGTPEDILPFFTMITDMIREKGFTRMERKAEHAEFLSCSSICGYHKCRFYVDDEMALGPVDSRMILRREGTAWKMYSITNSVSNDQFPYSFPKLSEGLVTLKEIQERTRK